MNGLLPYAAAGLLLASVTAYSTAGGVDFGAGIWDLLAGRSERGERARHLVDVAMGPVWETNNVWLVLGIVVCWTGFPTLFQAAFLNLYPLYVLALLGLILRGAFFAFRHVSDEPTTRRIGNVVFGVSSVVTPFFFAASLGAIASGRVQPDPDPASVLAICFTPMAVAFGLVSLAATALSGATFLVGDARRHGDQDLEAYFRRRALAAAAALVVTGTAGLAATWLERPQLIRAMAGFPAVLPVLATMILTPLVAFLLWRGILAWYRTLTVVAVSALVIAWGVAQSPYLLPGSLTIAQAAAPTPTLVVLVVSAAVVAFVIGPAMGLLYYLDQRSLLTPPTSH